MSIPSLLCIAATLASMISTAAAAYHFSPPDASVKLRGELTFTPNENGNTPFKCSVIFDLKTKTNNIKAVKFPRGEGKCVGLHFTALPWSVAIQDANSGQIGGGTFISGNGNCGQTYEIFQVNQSGIWTLPSGCVSGTLTSRPPTTIVP
jgi:hypothetical protein